MGEKYWPEIVGFLRMSVQLEQKDSQYVAEENEIQLEKKRTSWNSFEKKQHFVDKTTQETYKFTRETTEPDQQIVV